MRKKLALILYTSLLFSVICSAKGWKEEKAKYKSVRSLLVQLGIPNKYKLNYNGKTIVSNGTPELGINVHFFNDKVAENLKKADIHYVRHTIYWYNIEKTEMKGRYSRRALKKLDRLVSLYQKHKLHPVFVVHGNAPGCSFANRKEAYKRFADFMAMLASRYKYVQHWQLWNEMDVAFTDLFGARNKVAMKERGKYYAEMLKLSYPAIKKANPKAFVLTGGLVNWQEFPAGIYEGGGKSFFDIMSLHTYGVPLSWSFVSRGARLRKTMNDQGDQYKPIWNTEFGVSASSLVQAWGIPTKNASTYYDKKQKDMIADCIKFNRKAGIYQKYFPYVYQGNIEASKKTKERIIKSLPVGANPDDYGYGLVRKNGTPRPTMEYLYKTQPNRPNNNKRRELGDSNILDKLFPASRMKVVNGEIKMGEQAFFPLGFVFGVTEEALDKAKSVGMNSVHQEYSIRDVFPHSENAVSEKGLQKIKRLHKIIKKKGMTFFPLLTGHYIPGWLSQKAGQRPVDINGEKIGLWFKHSIHDPVYKKGLENFWTTVAKEVGEDPNAGAFVTWNEPAYGLDATSCALSEYKKAMQKQYHTIQAFNKAMNTSFESFGNISPPKMPDENRKFWYEWFCYNQKAFADFFKWQRKIFKKYAPQANLSGKHPVFALTGDALMVNDIPLQAMSQDVYGCDAYNGSLFHYRDVMEAARSFNPYGPVISYETHGQKGIPPLKPQHAALQLFVQILGGCRGIFFFAAGNVPGFGFFSDKATPHKVRAEYMRLFKLINSNQAVFACSRKKAQIAVLLSNPSIIHYGSNPDDSKKAEYTKRLSQTYDLIRNQHFAVDFIADSQLKDKLKKYKLLVIPSFSILSESDLKLVEQFYRKGGKIIAFGKSFERDEYFQKRSVPAVLGLNKREPAPWKRSQMRLVEVAPKLQTYFLTELIVQAPERVNPLPMKQLIPGYIPKTNLKKHIWLAANQDAYPSVIQSTDKQIIYFAFDSLYSEGLSCLIGGIIKESFKISQEVSIKRNGAFAQALELMSAINENDDFKVFLFANCGPNPGCWNVNIYKQKSVEMKNIVDGRKYYIKDGKFSFSLRAYGYAVFVIKK